MTFLTQKYHFRHGRLRGNTETRLQESIREKFTRFKEYISEINGSDFLTFKDRVYDQINSIAEDLKTASNREELEKEFYDICSRFDVSPLHKHCRQKPYGYSGDFEIIDWIYTKKTSPSGEGKFFDQMFQSYEAAEAVRNRKSYFVKKCLELAKQKKDRLDVLNLGCGPCRDVLEMYEASRNGTYIHLHCVDQEANAIAFAERLFSGKAFKDQIKLEHTDLFHLRTEQKYDLIWSAGLFDYLEPRIASILLKKIWRYLKDDGQIIFGNFSPENPTRYGMELAVHWNLIHRTANELVKLVQESRVPYSKLEVEKESLGVNLFCVIQK